MSDDSGKTDMSDVFVALFGNPWFWATTILVFVAITGFANAELVISGVERIVRAFKGG